MAGILKLAFKLVVNDRAKFAALVVGITFAVFLMVQITSVFSGILQKSSSTVINIGAPIWVMDPAVETVANSIPLPDYILDAVRSIDGVGYAVPLYSGGGLAKLNDGTYQSVTVIGLDDATLYGRPRLIEGNIQDLYGSNAFLIVRDPEYAKLGSPGIGTTFEINGHRSMIVGIAEVPISGLFGVPTLYTTFSRAVEYIPQMRYTYSYILVEPKSPSVTPDIKAAVGRLGYMALTIQEFENRVASFYEFQTGLGTNILMMTAISFLVGMSISGQAFFNFVVENMDKFGALKAIGAKGYELVAMILFQASVTGIVGYGFGVGLVSVLTAVARYFIPDYTTYIGYSSLALAFVMVLLIAGVSGYIAVRKITRVDPFDVFRG